MSIGSIACWRLADRTPIVTFTEAWSVLAPEGVGVVGAISPPKGFTPVAALRRALAPLGVDEVADGVFDVSRGPTPVRVSVDNESEDLTFEPKGAKLENAIRNDYRKNRETYSSDLLSIWLARVLQLRLDGVQIHPRLFFVPAEAVFNWTVIGRIIERANRDNYTGTVTTALDSQLTLTVFRGLRDEIETVTRRASKRTRIRLLKQKVARYEDRFQVKAADLRRRLQVAA